MTPDEIRAEGFAAANNMQAVARDTDAFPMACVLGNLVMAFANIAAGMAERMDATNEGKES